MLASIRGTTGRAVDPSNNASDFISLAERGLAMNGHDGNVAFRGHHGLAEHLPLRPANLAESTVWRDLSRRAMG